MPSSGGKVPPPELAEMMAAAGFDPLANIRPRVRKPLYRSAPEKVQIVAGPRANGKTKWIIEQVFGPDNEEVSGYPGWSRIMVVKDVRFIEDVIKPFLREMWPNKVWAAFDCSHKCYSATEWKQAHGIRPDTWVYFDLLAPPSEHFPGCIAAFTLNFPHEIVDPTDPKWRLPDYVPVTRSDS